jgi:hypothetical protein
MRENVFHSARFLDGDIEKEVCDVLLVHRDDCIVISIKAQAKKREKAATDRWLKKNGVRAVEQLGGAYRTLRDHPFWCAHALWGQRKFAPSSIVPRHGIALLECDFESIVDVPSCVLDQLAVVAPVTLMTLEDFVHVAQYLRTWRDLIAYLDSRVLVLGATPDHRTIGAETALFAFYTAMRDSFEECRGIADAKIVRAAGKHILENAAFRDRERGLAEILEDFINLTSSAEEVDLPPELEHIRDGLLALNLTRDIIRDDFCDLTIQERAVLGEQIAHLCDCEALFDAEDPIAFGAVRFGRYPTKVYVVVVARGLPPGEATSSAFDVTLAACAYYGKSVGIMVFLNEIGSDVRATLARVENLSPSPEYLQAGQEYFANVRPRSIQRSR